jgi:hypothetical protein
MELHFILFYDIFKTELCMVWPAGAHQSLYKAVVLYAE